MTPTPPRNLARPVRRALALLLLLGAWWLLPTTGYGQGAKKVKIPPDTPLGNVSCNIQVDSTVRIDFWIPFDGMVELFMYDHSKSFVGRNQYIKLKGENSIKLYGGGWLKPGQYFFTLVYKGREYNHSCSF